MKNNNNTNITKPGKSQDKDSSSNSTGSKPVIIQINNDFKNTTQELRDKITFAMMEKFIVDKSKPRIFDCIFESIDKPSAIKISVKLRKEYGYKTKGPHFSNDRWVTHAVNKIPYSELAITLKNIRIEAITNSSELVDWIMETDTETQKQ